MKDLYLIAGISKQGHAQSLTRQRRFEDKIPTYLGFIDQVRTFHPGMGLRAIYEQFEPCLLYTSPSPRDS